MNSPILIYDGECEFCKQSVTWIQQKLVITATPFQIADLASFNLSREQCAQQVYLIHQGETYGGADAIAHLLKLRGNTALWLLVKYSGKLAHVVYKWVATHRNTWPVRLATKVLIFLNR